MSYEISNYVVSQKVTVFKIAFLFPDFVVDSFYSTICISIGNVFCLLCASFNADVFSRAQLELLIIPGIQWPKSFCTTSVLLWFFSLKLMVKLIGDERNLTLIACHNRTKKFWIFWNSSHFLEFWAISKFTTFPKSYKFATKFRPVNKMLCSLRRLPNKAISNWIWLELGNNCVRQNLSA
jgi:hypothetical protein